MQQNFKRKISSLDAIFNFVNEFVTSCQINESFSFVITLVIEELFTNMVKYNRSTGGDITIGIEKRDQQLIVTLTDYGVEGFDVTRSGDVDITQSLQERKVGGLGLHLAKKMVDKLEYEYSKGESRTKFTKNLE